MVSDPPPPHRSPDTTDIVLLVFTGQNWHKAAVENPTADGSCGSGALRLLKELKRNNAYDVRSPSDVVRLAREMAFVHWTCGGVHAAPTPPPECGTVLPILPCGVP